MAPDLRSLPVPHSVEACLSPKDNTSLTRKRVDALVAIQPEFGRIWKPVSQENALSQFLLGNGNPTRERGIHPCVFFPRLRVGFPKNRNFKTRKRVDPQVEIPQELREPAQPGQGTRFAQTAQFKVAPSAESSVACRRQPLLPSKKFCRLFGPDQCLALNRGLPPPAMVLPALRA